MIVYSRITYIFEKFMYNILCVCKFVDLFQDQLLSAAMSAYISDIAAIFFRATIYINYR